MELELEHIGYRYGDALASEMQALSDISLKITGGEFIGVIGHTGSGKSTLMQIMNALERPGEGRILADGEDIWGEHYDRRSLRSRVGLVFQYPEHQLFETTVIGDNVTLYQGVTLGGTGKECGKRHPTLEDNVMVSAGAKILGSFTIGENSKIGAGSVVLKEVPPNCTVVGVPGRIVKRDDRRLLRSEMDQVHLPDPVLSDLSVLKSENENIQKELQKLQKKFAELDNVD